MKIITQNHELIKSAYFAFKLFFCFFVNLIGTRSYLFKNSGPIL